MIKSYGPKIRVMLRNNPDGLTCKQVFEQLGESSSMSAIRRCLQTMPDTYIDRWAPSKYFKTRYEAVWCVVTPPPDCPYPLESKS